jgi:hypothetical protein
MPKILISASRRTDIPACRSRWFFERLKAGFVTVPNPHNFRNQKIVSLLPQDVIGIVFWSKNPESLLAEAGRLEAYRWSVNFTLTGYDSALEPGLPPLHKRLEVFERLAQMIGPAKIQWRFDPILYTEKIGEKETVERFTAMLNAVDGLTTTCIASFYQPYAAAQRRLRQMPAIEPDTHAKDRLAVLLENRAREKGIQMRWCCQDWALNRETGHCADASLFSADQKFPKDRGQRQGCTCDKSVDIGTYDQCAMGCLYCYANQ